MQARCGEIAGSWGDEVRWDVLAHAATVKGRRASSCTRG